MSIYDQHLDKTPANFQTLTPLSFLERTARTFPDRTAIVHGTARTTYAVFYDRCRQLASTLAQNYISRGDTVSVMLANTPPTLEAHYGVPMIGAVLHSINTRLDAATLAFQLDHAETKVLIVDREFAGTVREALALANVTPLVIDYDDPEFPQGGEPVAALDYEAFIANGSNQFVWSPPADEWDAISLNYTSG
ncbi:MAG: AMP-binding protein, partial [Pseudomonadota bacterium]